MRSFTTAASRTALNHICGLLLRSDATQKPASGSFPKFVADDFQLRGGGGGHDESTGLMNECSCYFCGGFAVSHHQKTKKGESGTPVFYSPVDQHGSIVPSHERKLSMDDGKQ